MAIPTELPVWQALASESGVASDQIGEGATLLSKLTPEYAWTFARAFFPLSIGIERACKLALQVDAKLATGAFLTEREMRNHGHKLDGLVKSVDAVNQRRGFGVSMPNDPIHEAIIRVLTEFATNGRYHHLDNLAGRAGGTDPAKLWWETVVTPILTLHYKSDRAAKDEAMARSLGAEIDDFSVIQYRHVDGSAVSSMTDGLRDGARMAWSRMSA